MIVLTIINFVAIAIICYVAYEQKKQANNIQRDVEVLKRAKRLDHSKFNQQFDKFSHSCKSKMNKLHVSVDKLRSEFENEIQENRKSMEVSTKQYLNNWRNSTEFKSMLELIKQAERSSDSKNVY